MVRFKKLVCVVVFLFFLRLNAFAEDEAVALEKIVITPYRYSEEIAKTPASITLITQRDISNSNAQNILDLLRTVPALTVRDYFGNSAKASVDMRGFGEQGGMNVVVLVDGRRINEVDLSAVDWAQIPISQIERIEIVRGGNSVLYGDNSASGVINIITKRGLGKPQLKFSAEAGSYDRNSQQMSVSGSKNKLSYWAVAGREGTHGYRNNGFLKAQDFATKIIYDVFDDFYLNFSAGFRKSSFGFPGALSQAHIDNFSRRYSRFGNDKANDKDYYFNLGGEKSFGDLGELLLETSFRKKDVHTNFINANAGWNPYMHSFIDTISFRPQYKFKKNFLWLDNDLIIGLDYYRYDYTADTFDIAHALQNSSDINKDTLGGYVQNEIALLKNIILISGFRYEQAKYKFDFSDNAGFLPEVHQEIKTNQKVYNGGLAYKYSDYSSIFLRMNDGFRFPATDEYVTWGSLNTQLKTQESKNYEVGIRHHIDPDTDIELAIFEMDIKNELFYNPLGGPYGFGANENYSKTKHYGLEFSYDWQLLKNIVLSGNYAYTKSVFEGGIYDGNDVPLVPRHKAGISLKFLLLKYFNFNVFCNYTGDRYFLNDQPNSQSRLNGYFITDVNIAYSLKDFTVKLAINNIFNKKYSEFGVFSNNDKFYYPSPERNFNLKLEYKY